MPVDDLADEDTSSVAAPAAGADDRIEIDRVIPIALRELYEIHSYRHAASILWNAHPEIVADITECLQTFALTTADFLAAGGNETGIVRQVSGLLRTRDWRETRISADLLVKKTSSKSNLQARAKGDTSRMFETLTIQNFIDGHKIDFVKGRVAFDMEWNSKDQTFDRDLFAFSAFYECNIISAGVLLTRSAALNDVFRSLGIMTKYGASTTWMGKLLYRLNAGRNGGCPVLVFGITPKLVKDWRHT